MFSHHLLELVVGFVQTLYFVSEGDGSVIVIVEIKQGTVRGGDTVSLEFATKDKSATGIYIFLI